MRVVYVMYENVLPDEKLTDSITSKIILKGHMLLRNSRRSCLMQDDRAYRRKKLYFAKEAPSIDPMWPFGRQVPACSWN